MSEHTDDPERHDHGRRPEPEADAGEAGVFRALADPTRRQILTDLRDGELAAGEIARRFSISAPSISRHLGVLKGAGLVAERRDGNRILYSLVEDRLATSVGRFLSAVCPEQIVLRRTAWRDKGAPS
ncbi:metalloregulator ArsR/SmtB family transcription factor [Streptomyces sp. NPDC053755]|uniref:metalloregulator ArsR/SmtB family transcription factor n=1 Tax=Streptomyces sp. NPDC053755 TaxID=3155815 RepID=UPI00344A9849